MARRIVFAARPLVVFPTPSSTTAPFFYSCATAVRNRDGLYWCTPFNCHTRCA
jgi:hypothetical protein